MKKLRPLLSALLGLTLLVQGFGVAAAAPATTADAATAAAEQMPCHGEARNEAASSCPCCDSACIDMTSCALGHMAAVPASAVQFSPAAQSVVALTPRPTATGFSPSLLRPPIPLHA